MLYSSDFSDLEPILVGGLEARRGYLLAHPPGPMEPPGLDGEAIAEPGLGAGPSEREMLAYPCGTRLTNHVFRRTPPERSRRWSPGTSWPAMSGSAINAGSCGRTPTPSPATQSQPSREYCRAPPPA